MPLVRPNRVPCRLISPLILALCSCVVGPKAELKSPLNVLNGENYHGAADGSTDRVVIPIMKAKARLTNVQGLVYTQDAFAQIPMRFQKVQLKARDKILVETTSNEKGEYRISEVIPNGHYMVMVISDQYRGQAPLHISAYENPNVNIRVDRKP
jgi:hypothetical protein